MATEVKVPDIGDFKEVEVIEVLVKPGDSVAKEQSLITLESDKATMEIPSPDAGVVKELRIKVGDKVSKGSAIMVLETAGAQAAKTDLPKSPQAASPAPVAGADRGRSRQSLTVDDRVFRHTSPDFVTFVASVRYLPRSVWLPRL